MCSSGSHVLTLLTCHLTRKYFFPFVAMFFNERVLGISHCYPLSRNSAVLLFVSQRLECQQVLRADPRCPQLEGFPTGCSSVFGSASLVIPGSVRRNLYVQCWRISFS